MTAATPLGPLKHLPQDHFSLTVVDEAGQALEAACWVVASRASELVLAGDHLRLPPTILSRARCTASRTSPSPPPPADRQELRRARPEPTSSTWGQEVRGLKTRDVNS